MSKRYTFTTYDKVDVAFYWAVDVEDDEIVTYENALDFLPRAECVDSKQGDAYGEDELDVNSLQVFRQ